jgi:hypothetical protein
VPLLSYVSYVQPLPQLVLSLRRPYPCHQPHPFTATAATVAIVASVAAAAVTAATTVYHHRLFAICHHLPRH